MAARSGFYFLRLAVVRILRVQVELDHLSLAKGAVVSESYYIDMMKCLQ